MRITIDHVIDRHGRSQPLEINENKSRQIYELDLRYTITASATVRETPETMTDPADFVIEDIEIDSVERTQISWSKPAGYRDMSEDHEGANPDQVQYLNEQLEERDDWYDIIHAAVVAEYARQCGEPVAA